MPSFSNAGNVKLVESPGRAGGFPILVKGSLAPELPKRVNGDPARLRQILINLIGNAIKFTERGEIGVQVRSARQSANECIVVVEVVDTGPGIDRALQTCIFEAFSQGDGSTTRTYGRTA